ncbi:MAG: cytidine deaminase [Bacteroidetes bacterium GWA2_30_7]|nr:MAG: cytidine deaminase [Bacteroidetes bacterium GWA2_30_7]
MRLKEIVTKVLEFDSESEFNTQDSDLIKIAKANINHAYSPYSKFSVSAAIQLDNNETVTGTNQENAAYPSGLCAERVAMFYANSKFPESKPLTIAIAAFTNGDFLEVPIPPCGSCRQVLLESEIRYKSPIRVILIGKSKIFLLENVKSLLPLSFDGGFLKVK